MKFENKIVLITGAAHGMGKNHAKAFINEGATVIITDINEELGKQTAVELGDKALFIKHDVAEEADWINVVNIINEKFGKLDVLVNNAGVMPFGPLGMMTFDDYKKYIGINQFSVFLNTLCKSFKELWQRICNQCKFYSRTSCNALWGSLQQQ
ncbi:MAG: SDR family NAD(P)-dependent oxidoreductase [Agathobacter sp.]|nr:SDR family NAD(P)-dependent oxidoreductase [Agathobacter sp.]